MSDTVVVFRDRKAREIKTYVNLDGHGAQVDLVDFLSLVSEFYGSPASTMTRKGHLAHLLKSAEQAITHMKGHTREVAAVNLEPQPKSG